MDAHSPEDSRAADAEVVIGLAGHVDHGKSSLVRALTGVDPDRLPEERRRQMTIDLGFACLEEDRFRCAFIDVPGHERFVHNMLAGASGVDYGLLVIAADDGVMPQTREHLSILQSLGVPGGLIAVTKADLVDAAHMQLVRQEVRELVEGTSFAAAPVVDVSIVTGTGLDRVRQIVLGLRGNRVRPRDAQRPLRLPIDRVFTLSGHGTVITGTVMHGTLRLKDNIRLLPQDRMVRVRGLQRHGRAAESVAAGERAAVNLAGVSASELHRGNELVAPGAYEGSTRMIVELVMHAGARHPVRHRGTVRLHLAAAEVTAKVLLAAPELRAESEPSGDARTGESPAEYAVLVCAGPVIAEYGQPFVVRALSPTATIGGGRVLAPQIPGGARLGDCLRCASRLASEDPLTRLCGLLDLSARPEEPGHALAVRVGVAVEALRPMFELLATDGRVLPLGEPARYVSAARVERLAGELERVCERELERRRPSRLLPASVVTGRLERRIDPQVIEAAMSLLLRQGRMIMRDNRIGPSDSGDSGTSMPPGGAATPAAGRAGQLTAAASPRGMTHRQRQILGGFQKQCEESGWTPPTLKEYAAQHRLRESELAALVQFAVDDGLLVRVSPELAIPPDVLESLRQSLQDLLAIAAGVTVAQIRDHWSMTRKHAIPYLEFLDRLGVTVRDGDVRRAGPRFHESLDEIIP